MIKKIIFNAVIIIVLIMIGVTIIKANNRRPNINKGVLNNMRSSPEEEALKREGLDPREAKYYRVIEE